MRPPSEFIGQARLLRQRVAIVDELVQPTIDRALAPLRSRLKRHPRRPLREGDLIDARRLWQTTPAYGCLGRSIDISDRRSAKFRELRIAAVKFGLVSWSGAETAGLAVSLICVTAKRGKLVYEPRVIAAASLHALARRIERCRERSDEAIFADLAHLAWQWPQLIDAGSEEFVMPCSEGSWAGRLALLDDGTPALADTWLTADHAVCEPTAHQSLEDLIAALPVMVRA